VNLYRAKQCKVIPAGIKHPLVSYPSSAPERQKPYGADGGDMKNSFVLFVIVSGVLFTSMHAATKAGYEPATVVSVETHAIPSDYAGGDPFPRPSGLEPWSE
jgi:hypothetical protein